jgi:hypothetical protein
MQPKDVIVHTSNLIELERNKNYTVRSTKLDYERDSTLMVELEELPNTWFCAGNFRPAYEVELEQLRKENKELKESIEYLKSVLEDYIDTSWE